MPAVMPERPECGVLGELLPMRGEGSRIGVERGLARSGQSARSSQWMCGCRQRMGGRPRDLVVPQVGVTGNALIEMREPGGVATGSMSGGSRVTSIEAQSCMPVEVRGCMSGAEVWCRVPGEVRNAAARTSAAKMRGGTEMRSAAASAAHTWGAEMGRAATATSDMGRSTSSSGMTTTAAAGMAATTAAARFGGERRAGSCCQHQTDDAGTGRDLEYA